MSGAEFTGGDFDPRIDIPEQYAGTSANVRSRFKPYEFTYDGSPTTHEQIIDDVAGEIVDGYTVLDVGCSDGQTLSRLSLEIGHRGRLIGVDIDDLSLATNSRMRKAGKPPIEFRVESALDIQLEDASVDVVLALFLLYHVDYRKALAEFKRVLRPGGLLYVATSGPNNKLRHREFETQAAHALGVEPPPVFASRFDNAKADHVLPQYFSVTHQEAQQTYMVIDNEHSLSAYELSLQSMSSACNPAVPGGTWARTITQLVMPQITKSIEEKGAFFDTIDRYWYKCENI